MWALGFLLLIIIYILLSLLIIYFSPKKLRIYLHVILWATPLLLPFSYYIAPSYYEFKSLCNDANRIIISKSIELNFIPPFSSRYSGYKMMTKKNYSGFEYYEGRLLFRYIKNEKYKTKECETYCSSNIFLEWEKQCPAQCFNKIQINSPSGGVKFEFANFFRIKDRLVQHEQIATNQHEEIIAKTINYKYLLYGNGIARILGMSSGSAPSISCDNSYNIFNFDFLETK